MPKKYPSNEQFSDACLHQQFSQEKYINGSLETRKNLANPKLNLQDKKKLIWKESLEKNCSEKMELSKLEQIQKINIPGTLYSLADLENGHINSITPEAYKILFFNGELKNILNRNLNRLLNRALHNNLMSNTANATDSQKQNNEKNTSLKRTGAIRKKSTRSIKDGKRKKYHSGNASELRSKLDTENYTIKPTGKTAKNGGQAKISFVRLRTESENEVDIVKKQAHSNGSNDNERKLSYVIERHLNYSDIKSSFCLPFYEEKRASGNALLSYCKEADLETFRNYIYQHAAIASSYLFYQLKALIDALNFLHNSHFTDEKGKAHSGILHGDIKPDNILIAKDGKLSFADFGCTRYKDEPFQQSGHVYYASPELLKALGESPLGKIYPHSDKWDIWSLGVSFNFLITDEHPLLKPQSLTEKKQDENGYLLKGEMAQTTTDANFFSNTAEGQRIRGSVATSYLQSSEILNKKREGMEIIETLCNPTLPANDANFTPKEILQHIIASMLLPNLERPSAKKLVGIMDALSVYFSKSYGEKFAQALLSDYDTKYFETDIAKLCLTEPMATQAESDAIKHHAQRLSSFFLHPTIPANSGSDSDKEKLNDGKKNLCLV